ncbi:hypothetical protein [Natronoflexus pectinivorans]|uniref:TolB-like protein n=1 Tax=Natronoflexus pectinivorans TaxID=682526 RepID=A0A4R2G9R5_9BACT|nr:hypothetical protein [Natronoflexus pectinivorans]TCO04432.1 hypothetical protein EV194_11821 [Natronoflexus pectinivorans]
MREFIFLVIGMFLIATACQRNTSSYVSNHLNKDVNIVLKDSLVLIGDDEIFSSGNFSIISKEESVYKIFDHLTKTILVLNTSKKERARIVSQIDLSLRYGMNSGFIQNLLGVKKIHNQQFILISFPYSIIADSNFDFVEKILFQPESADNIFNPAGSIQDICYDEHNHCLYIPFFPDIPYTHNDHFDTGRIIEVNLLCKSIKVLPVGLPADYESGKNYGYFSLPFVTVFNNSLFYIFGGSNILNRMDLETLKNEAIMINPQHADISATHLSGNILEQIRKQLTHGTFYRIIEINGMLMLFYREGIQNGTLNTSNKGTLNSNRFVMGYSIDTNEILYDIPLNINKTSNEPVFSKNGMMYFLKSSKMMEYGDISATFYKYRFEVQDY